MTKNSRKYRKASTRALGDSPKNVACPRGDFQSKPARTTTNRGCSSKRKRQNNKMKKEEKKQLRRSQKQKDCTSITPIESWASVWFFIPLDSQDPFHRKVPTDKKFDFSNLLVYLPNELTLEMYVFKSTVPPELKFKRRTESESSDDSEDFICFEDDDSHDDSFICFEEGDEDTHDDSFICFEEGDDDTDDDDDDDDNNNSSVKYNSCASIENSVSESEQSSSSDETPKKKKRVGFVDNSRLVTVHTIVAWDYAYRAARVSQWMTMARDAKRFQRKIESLEPILSPILSSEHRARIRETRMLTEV